MQVLALIGPSGSGKSFRAQLVARELGTQTIIDDGLLIYGTRILAGSSAKKQPTRIGAIRTALFTDPKEAAIVKEKLRELAPQRVLILATSKEMARRIAQNLDLPAPEEFIHIQEIAPPEVIARARRIRERFGSHVVPVPTVEVKPRFSGTLVEPLRSLWRRSQVGVAAPNHQLLWVEQTVVRPTFTYLGRFYIANEALASIATYAAGSLGYTLSRVNVISRQGGVTISGELEFPYGVVIPNEARRVQERIRRVVEHMTGLNVLSVNLTVVRLIFR